MVSAASEDGITTVCRQAQACDITGVAECHIEYRGSGAGWLGLGFVSSGMFVVNPPWKLAETLRETLPYLVTLLRKDQGACFTVETGENNS